MGGLQLLPDTSLPVGEDCIPLIGIQEQQERVIELDEGDQVKIKDASGAIVGTAELAVDVTDDKACRWSFTTAVPAGGRFYTAEVESFVTPALNEDDADGVLIFDLAEDL